MIEKEIKEYKQGRDTVQRINIRKIDNLKGKICILKLKEYDSLITENKELKETISKQDNEMKKIKETIAIQKKEDKTIQSILEIQQKTIEKMDHQQQATFKELNQQHDETISKITKEHQNHLKETYEQFNKEINNYITVNQLQNTALKQILELGFIDILRGNHKKLAKDRINDLNHKTVYELTKKDKK